MREVEGNAFKDFISKIRNAFFDRFGDNDCLVPVIFLASGAKLYYSDELSTSDIIMISTAFFKMCDNLAQNIDDKWIEDRAFV